MTRAQERHAKAMARAALTHVQSMERKMHALIREDLQHVPVEVVTRNFEELEGDWNSVQAVVTDMLPELMEE